MGNTNGLSGENLILARMKASMEDMMADSETTFEHLTTSLDAYRIKSQPQYYDSTRV